MGVITDSGGITEETTVLGVRVLLLEIVLRDLKTVTFGTNVLVGDDKDDLIYNLREMLSGSWKESSIPPLWDGASGKRIVECLQNIMFIKEDDKQFKFTFKNIQKEYERLLEMGYRVITCSDYAEKNYPLSHKVVVNRIDIDVSVKKAERLGEIYSSLDIKGSFL